LDVQALHNRAEICRTARLIPMFAVGFSAQTVFFGIQHFAQGDLAFDRTKITLADLAVSEISAFGYWRFHNQIQHRVSYLSKA
jgi:hypothetical protein